MLYLIQSVLENDDGNNARRFNVDHIYHNKITFVNIGKIKIGRL